MPNATRFSRALLWLLPVPLLIAQSTVTLTSVPRLVRVESLFHPANGQPASPVESVTFSIYAAETGGAALWQETQNVTIDAEGRYAALLGSTLNAGIPQELFAKGEPRWLGVQFNRSGEREQRRTLLASVPYALKAADSDTLGGLPASAFLLNPSALSSTGAPSTVLQLPTTSSKLAPRFNSTGTTGSIAMFTDASGDVGNSVLFQSAAARIGLGTTNPQDYIHVTFNDPNGATTGLAVQNLSSSATAYSGMLFYDQNGNLQQFQGFNNSTHEYRINNIARNGSNQFNGTINFMVGSNSKFFVGSNGNIGIGTTTPASTLDVAGTIHTSSGVVFPDGTEQISATGPQWFSVFLPGSLNVSWTGGHIVPDQNIAVKRVTVDLKTAGSVCSPATIHIGGATNGQDVSIPTGTSTYDSGPEVIPFSANGSIAVSLKQGAMCANGYPQDANVLVQYYPAAPASSTCASGDSNCGGICVNTNYNPSNCGTCGAVCSLPNATSACESAMCVTLSCNPGFGNCTGNSNAGCPTNLNTSNTNCGVCGTTCTPNGACVNGSCQCSSGFANCSGNPGAGCSTNLNTDSSNCGLCGHVCPGGSTCTSGACQCGAGLTMCLNTCTNTNTDSHNCGGCGNVCGNGQTCQNAKCAP